MRFRAGKGHRYGTLKRSNTLSTDTWVLVNAQRHTTLQTHEHLPTPKGIPVYRHMSTCQRPKAYQYVLVVDHGDGFPQQGRVPHLDRVVQQAGHLDLLLELRDQALQLLQTLQVLRVQCLGYSLQGVGWISDQRPISWPRLGTKCVWLLFEALQVLDKRAERNCSSTYIPQKGELTAHEPSSLVSQSIFGLTKTMKKYSESQQPYAFTKKSDKSQ